MRAVVDTNVLVSGLMGAAGPPGQVAAAIVAGELRLVLSEDILAEYRAVLPRPRLRIRPEHIAQLLNLIERVAGWVPVLPCPGTPPLPDLDDWPFIAAARMGACPLITGNARHFPARLGVEVMTARGWCESLDGRLRGPGRSS